MDDVSPEENTINHMKNLMLFLEEVVNAYIARHLEKVTERNEQVIIHVVEIKLEGITLKGLITIVAVKNKYPLEL